MLVTIWNLTFSLSDYLVVICGQECFFLIVYPIVIHYSFCGDNDAITNILHLDIFTFFRLNDGKVAASQRTLGKSVKENVGD